MEKGEGKVNELENLKKKIKESLTKDEGYIELLEKKNRLINSLKQIEANRYEARTLLEKYDMIGNDIKELELKPLVDLLSFKDLFSELLFILYLFQTSFDSPYKSYNSYNFCQLVFPDST